MAQTKILVDTNSYFRLAQNLHPLMCQPFGAKNYTLYAHKDLNFELKKVSRIKGKLQWVSEKKYLENRKRSVTIPSNKQNEIDQNYEYMWEHAKAEFHQVKGKGPGDTDTLILATALALDICVITDDQDMTQLAKDFEVSVMTSLELLKLMLTEAFITNKKINMIVEQWQYDNDTPHKNWKQEFKTLFNKMPPICKH